jgi:hypothetical protein
VCCGAWDQNGRQVQRRSETSRTHLLLLLKAPRGREVALAAVLLRVLSCRRGFLIFARLHSLSKGAEFTH